MAKLINGRERKSVVKRTRQGGGRPKTSAMNKSRANSFKKYRGQGK
jgi:hypothetical protein